MLKEKTKGILYYVHQNDPMPLHNIELLINAEKKDKNKCLNSKLCKLKNELSQKLVKYRVCQLVPHTISTSRKSRPGVAPG